MTRKSNKKILSLILSMMLIVAMAFSMTACGDNKEKPNTGTEADAGGVNNTKNDAGAQDETDVQMEATVVGEGDTVFTFIVVDAEGEEKTYEVHTAKTIVGEALLELELIAGDVGDYGLYVKTVDGITVDYDTDGK